MMLRQRHVCGQVRVLAAAMVAGLLASAAALPASAQNATPVPTAEVPTGNAAQPTPEQLATAVQFLKASGLTVGFDDIIPQYLQQATTIYTGQRPELSQLINEAAISLVPEFMKKRVELDNSLAKFYTTRFSEDELKQLITFYESPVGKKLATQQQIILRDSMPVVQGWTRDLQDGVMKRVREEVEKKGGKLGPSPADAPAEAQAPAKPAQ
ncbi:DUF2059 domain-containing protein [Labrys sp. (in: a-proteobacteria)]|uniref:DUF2059 domain-containing protein n=1 Tax=Labrys sp. (in: a-proteobacteria) TaxID=1917972 RepID=UPI0039E5A732